MILRKVYKHGKGLKFQHLSSTLPRDNVNMGMSLVWQSQRFMLMRSSTSAATCLNQRFRLPEGNLQVNSLTHLPMAFLNKRQRVKIRMKEYRKKKQSEASFNKTTELRKIMNIEVVQNKSSKDDVVILEPAEAFKEIEAQMKTHIDESIDLCIKLGIDPVKSDQQVRATVTLPAGTGREVKVAIFTSQENMALAQNSGADLIVDLNHIRDLTAETLSFDKLVATSEVIKLLKPFGRTIGPLGLMPNVKSGTLVEPNELLDTVKILKAGRIEVRNDNHAIVHACIGKRRFPNESLLENLKAVVSKLNQIKPENLKGEYFKW